MVAKIQFSTGSRIVNSNVYLNINVIDRLIFGKSCIHEIDLKIYVKNFMMTSHVNCILVCNAGEMVKVRPWITYLLKRMCLGYITPRKDVLGVHSSLEGCTGCT